MGLTIVERLHSLNELFVLLEKEPSRNQKERMISFWSRKDKQLAEDIQYALEILDGRHKLGYTFHPLRHYFPLGGYNNSNISLKQYLDPLYRPKRFNKYDLAFVEACCAEIDLFPEFIDKLVNRKFRLGIGASQLPKEATSPMLGKKFDANKIPKSDRGYFITEKLDGNRCLAKYSEALGAWQFFSRSGKPLKVNFDMYGFPIEYIFDGEIIQRKALKGNKSQQVFNETSGLVNSKYGNKQDLVYVVFDYISDELDYEARRADLDSLSKELDNLRIMTFNKMIAELNTYILPLIAKVKTIDELVDSVTLNLPLITKAGGEGLMINVGDRAYEQKRTDGLLKVKEVLTMDMKVIDLYPGTGKFEGVVGALECFCRDEQGISYSCKVGSGLSEVERFDWAEHPEKILGKIVEVSYFSLSQDAKTRGSSNYTLRFPRLKGVRDDKSDTSVN